MRVAERLTRSPEKFVLTLFGGEPLLNLPVTYYLAEQCYAVCQERGVTQHISVITNGLLMTPEVVDRLNPYGLQGIKITLDGDRETHNRMRPLRGRQGTFDKIIDNISKSRTRSRSPSAATRRDSWESYPSRAQFRASRCADTSRRSTSSVSRRRTERPKASFRDFFFVQRRSPRREVHDDGGRGGGRRRPVGVRHVHFLDEKMASCATKAQAVFPTVDAPHGAVLIHSSPSTRSPVTANYACPGFSGRRPSQSPHRGHEEPCTRNVTVLR